MCAFVKNRPVCAQRPPTAASSSGMFTTGTAPCRNVWLRLATPSLFPPLPMLCLINRPLRLQVVTPGPSFQLCLCDCPFFVSLAVCSSFIHQLTLVRTPGPKQLGLQRTSQTLVSDTIIRVSTSEMDEYTNMYSFRTHPHQSPRVGIDISIILVYLSICVFISVCVIHFQAVIKCTNA